MRGSLRHKGWSLLLPAMLLACVLGLGLPGLAQAWTVDITEDQIQAEVATMFPIRQQLPFVTAVFSDPRMHIVTGSDRMRLALTVTTTFPNQVEAKGQAEIEGSLGYDATTGEFHLIRPAVTQLQSDLLQQDSLELVRLMANAIAEQYITHVAIYRLDERDFQQGMMRRKLKGIQVRDGKFIAELDW